MKVNVLERLMLQSVLPKEGSYATLKITRDLAGELGFSEADWKTYKIVQEGEQIKWDDKTDAAEQKDVKFGEKATDLIIKELEKLNKDEKLTPQLMTLYEKFVKTKED